MAYRVSISSTELVTRAEVLAYAKIENTDENTIIDALITSSREELENLLKIPLITQVWAQTYDSFIEPVYAPMIPLTSAALEIADSDGNFSANTYISVKKTRDELRRQMFSTQVLNLTDSKSRLLIQFQRLMRR